MNHVQVKSGARLHFGLLCGAPDSDWHYGGIGMMVDSPAWQMNISRHTSTGSDEIEDCSTTTRGRVESVLKQFRTIVPDLPPVRCAFQQEAPFHNGLGSGTQLTLSVTMALWILSGRPRPDNSAELAAAMGRTRRSGIGTFGFDYGGFIDDHGLPASSDTARRISHQRFPDHWRMVLLTPTRSEGLSGSTEESFFRSEGFLNQTQLAAIAPLVIDGIVPALRSENFSLFRESLEQYGTLVGAYYSGAQGGVFSDPRIPTILDGLKSAQISGAVQSSWGPTVCIPAESDTHAQFITSALQSRCRPTDFSVHTAGPLNVGACITTPAPGHRC